MLEKKDLREMLQDLQYEMKNEQKIVRIPKIYSLFWNISLRHFIRHKRLNFWIVLGWTKPKFHFEKYEVQKYFISFVIIFLNYVCLN